MPALLDSKPFAVSMAKDTRGLPAAVRAKQRPAAAATGALPPIKQAPSRLEAAQHREAARRYVEDMLGVRLPTDHWDRVGRVTRLPVDIASAAEVATLPTAPPEWRGRPRGWEGAGPGEGQGSVVRTRLRDMQSRRMRLAPLGTGAMGVTPSSATGDTGVLAPWDREVTECRVLGRESRSYALLTRLSMAVPLFSRAAKPMHPFRCFLQWSAAPPSAPSVASLRAALRPPLDSFDSERPSSARPASRGADGRSSKEPLADRQSRPSTASQGRRMSSEKGDKGTDAPTETGKADTGPQAADVGGEDSVARDVLRLGKVAGTGKPMRPMT